MKRHKITKVDEGGIAEELGIEGRFSACHQ